MRMQVELEDLKLNSVRSYVRETKLQCHESKINYQLMIRDTNGMQIKEAKTSMTVQTKI